MGLIVTPEAKIAAKQGLLSDSGLSIKKAKELGIVSGRQTAKLLLKSKSINQQEASRVARFYSRFKNCKTTRCENAIKLWGGRAFGRKAVEYIKRLR